ncbi:MAG: RNA polymerase subunit sigma-24 [Verrucomicrobia bacterium]|nr:RNA polymerase subunit sigma-24 [Verrucomicrobiota bacterium]
MSDVTLLLAAVERGESQAAEELLPLVYDELRHLATTRMAGEAPGQTLQPTALVHEAWLRLVNQKDPGWNNRVHFFRAAALAMRRILVDNARSKASLKGGQRTERLNIDDLDLAAAPPDDRILMIDEALGWLETHDPECARIVTLRFFGGFTIPEIARAQGASERTIARQWAYAKACLFQFIREDPGA